MRGDQLVTVDDLDRFKADIIGAVEQIVAKNTGQPVKKWLKSAEVRKLLDASPGKLKTMRNSGLLAFTRIGGDIYYDQDDIQMMFEKNKKCNKTSERHR
jgi:hypothetical protein